MLTLKCVQKNKRNLPLVELGCSVHAARRTAPSHVDRTGCHRRRATKALLIADPLPILIDPLPTLFSPGEHDKQDKVVHYKVAGGGALYIRLIKYNARRTLFLKKKNKKKNTIKTAVVSPKIWASPVLACCLLSLRMHFLKFLEMSVCKLRCCLYP